MRIPKERIRRPISACIPGPPGKPPIPGPPMPGPPGNPPIPENVAHSALSSNPSESLSASFKALLRACSNFWRSTSPSSLEASVMTAKKPVGVILPRPGALPGPGKPRLASFRPRRPEGAASESSCARTIMFESDRSKRPSSCKEKSALFPLAASFGVLRPRLPGPMPPRPPRLRNIFCICS